ncbi:MAG: 23S rRNA (adenine(2030)-N(6))-methyltransferase RlmJ [Proteobacteria bacterium]|nr:23S rRNA (adenine(2030)-N(6))-methyltransferase RlmJ [Pseudomonadota bacterium]
MKYRHSFHAGNFADVHKHVTLLALISALQRKDKGFLYLETHAGRGAYDISTPNADAAGGIGRLGGAPPAAAEIAAYLALLGRLRAQLKQRHLYPGSPLLALASLRPQDRAVLVELQGSEVNALKHALADYAQAHAPAPATQVERGDGYARLRAWLPPPERRGLTFIDPPYEQTGEDFTAVTQALAEGLRRFPTGIMAAWYPIKDERTTNAWLQACRRALTVPLLVSELWLFPRDSRVALNGSGLLIANPPHPILGHMQLWLPQLQAALSGAPAAGSRALMLAD